MREQARGLNGFHHPHWIDVFSDFSRDSRDIPGSIVAKDEIWVFTEASVH
jgi:hypothetical protein